jgi:hypothetical protein
VTTTFEQQWEELAAVALLGADRRPTPEPLAGALSPFGSAPLDQVAALNAARRGGLRASAPITPLPAPPDDLRPICPPPATARLAEILEQWPVLIDEWLQVAATAGWRLAPEVVPGLLVRFRGDPHRRSTVVALAGPVADWLVDLDLAPVASGKPPAKAEPPFALPADLAGLWQLESAQLAAALIDGLGRAQLANRHRPVLVRLICDVPVAALEVVAEGLSRSATNASTMGLALTLADLAQTRASMIQELQP